MEIKANILEKLEMVAARIIEQAGKRKIILLEGEMGAGKTTLIKEICLKLGVQDIVSSPTFGIVNEYVGAQSVVYHFDAYRLEDEDEAYDIGVEEYLDSGNWCLIEWPDKIAGLLPSEDEMMKVEIKEEQGVRTYTSH